MLKPQVVSEKPITMAQVKDALSKVKKRDGELNFRANKTEEYLQQFVKLKKSDAENLVKKITDLNVPRLKEDHIVKIVDIHPQSLNDLKVVLQGYTITVNNENLNKILACLKD